MRVIRLGGLLAEALPASAEVWGLLALMELHGARAATRTGIDGETILLERQDRSRWDGLGIARGLDAAHLVDRVLPEVPIR